MRRYKICDISMNLLRSRSYQIYAHSDPRNDKARYVGMSFDAFIRFYYGHLGGNSGGEHVNQWISEPVFQ